MISSRSKVPFWLVVGGLSTYLIVVMIIIAFLRQGPTGLVELLRWERNLFALYAVGFTVTIATSFVTGIMSLRCRGIARHSIGYLIIGIVAATFVLWQTSYLNRFAASILPAFQMFTEKDVRPTLRKIFEDPQHPPERREFFRQFYATEHYLHTGESVSVLPDNDGNLRSYRADEHSIFVVPTREWLRGLHGRAEVAIWYWPGLVIVSILCGLWLPNRQRDRNRYASG